ncbi:PREDICTED: ras-related protein Rab-35-like [Acropora digitifera]|uniref:ras-related protein Rab-35-like n=1 Tax=Acropora digitifera TaxID=70779 RepID=UPI00077AD195|nr:PREDICTED: ras-related protein Rab-35-like [Acropora digitifera]
MTSNSKDYDISYKVLVIGESAVGKTSLIKSYSKPDETFTPSLMPTYGIDFVNIITRVDGVSVRMQIWDTAGQERFRTLTSMHFRGTKVRFFFLINNICRKWRSGAQNNPAVGQQSNPCRLEPKARS